MKSLNKFLILFFFIFSVPSIGLALPECGNTLHNCTGTYTWKNGDKYVGDWKNNKNHGKGTYIWKSGNKYEGDWVNDKKHGKGTYIWKDGTKYVGDWKNNKKHGFGTYYWNDGDKYVGDFLNDKKHGKGRYTYKSGNKYDGDWVNDKRTGEGVFTFANGKKQEGVFKDSKFLYSKKIDKQRNINKDDENPLSLALNKKPVEIKKATKKINKESNNSISSALNKKPVEIKKPKKTSDKNLFEQKKIKEKTNYNPDWFLEVKQANKNIKRTKSSREIMQDQAKSCQKLSKNYKLSLKFINQAGKRFKTNPFKIRIISFKYVLLLGCQVNIAHNYGSTVCSFDHNESETAGKQLITRLRYCY